MKKVRLVHFRYRLSGAEQSAALAYAESLTRRRGLTPPPTRYIIKFLIVRIHPDDVPAVMAYCRALDLAAGRIPWI